MHDKFYLFDNQISDGNGLCFGAFKGDKPVGRTLHALHEQASPTHRVLQACLPFLVFMCFACLCFCTYCTYSWRRGFAKPSAIELKQKGRLRLWDDQAIELTQTGRLRLWEAQVATSPEPLTEWQELKTPRSMHA